MSNRKSLKSLSERFYLKSQKEFANVYTQFSTNLVKDISQYLSQKEYSNETSNTFKLLETALKSTQDDVEITEPAFPVMVLIQTNIIRNTVKTTSENHDASSLEKVLKKLLLDGNCFDIVLKVENELFLSHKDVLCARSCYFKAMLQTNSLWSEANNDSITLNGMSSKSFAVYLCHLYGIFVDCSCTEKAEIMNLMQTADMLGADDMKAALVLFMQRDKCHFFHKPCSDCIEGIPMVFQISEQFSLDKLQRKCLKWNTNHFSRLWPTKRFCYLSSAIRERCYTAVIESMNVHTVTNITLEADEVIGRLTVIKWALPVIQMAARLLDTCKDFISQHLFELTETTRIFPLFLGMGCRSNLVEDIAAKTSANLSPSNACTQHLAVRKLLAHAEQDQWGPFVTNCFKSLDQRVTNFLTANYYAVIHSEHWSLLSADYKSTLQAATLCQGDLNRKPRHKPVLSSSVLSQCKSQPTKLAKKKEKVKRTKSAATSNSQKHIPSNLPKKLNEVPKQMKSPNSSLVHPPLIPPSPTGLVSPSVERDDKEDHVSSNQNTDLAFKALVILQSPAIARDLLYAPAITIPPTVFRPYSLEDPVLNIPILR